MTDLQVNHGGTWSSIANASVKVSGVWTQVQNAYAKVSGVWTLIWQNIHVTPDPVTWSDITGVSFGTNEDNTISGINTTITLRMTFTGSATPGGDVGYRKNASGPYSSFKSAPVDVAFDNGNQLGFDALASAPGDSISGTVTIINLSDSGALVGSFTVGMTNP